MPTTQTDWSGYHSDKDNLRSHIWELLKQHQVSHRDPVGHIPTFKGAEAAAERLAALPIWQLTKVIKCNPDSAQLPVRLRALEAGKRLYMAVPRLTRSHCFVELTRTDLQQRSIPLETAAIARNALKLGRLVRFEEMEPIDLVIVGCVAAARNGGRTGKGAGFADLELAMLKSFGLVQDHTPIVTTVHSLQVVESDRLPMQVHDWALNYIVTPDQIIETHSIHPRPVGLDWETIRPEQYQKIPILRHLREQASRNL
jgi:5-formyltetrahydrofolate cyclo-ligase